MAQKPNTPLGAVRGFEIMNNLGDTMRTVLETNKPFGEDIQRGGLSVAFNGDQAFSSWARRNDAISGVINAPALAPDAHLSRHQADLYVGYGLHELGHMCYSDHAPFEKMDKTQGTMGTALLKALEDPRVEEAVMASKMTGNSKALFENLSCAMYSNAITQGYDANDISWLPLTLSLLGRERRGQRFPEAKDIRAAMDPAKLKLVDEALAMMDKAALDASGTKDARKAAQHIIDTLNLPPQPNKGKGKGEKGKGQPEEGEGESESEGEGEEGEGEGQGEGQEGEEGGQAGKAGGQGQGQQQGQQQGKGQSQGKGEGKPKKGKPGEYAKGGGGSGYSKHGSGAQWTPQDLKDAAPQQAGPEQTLTKAAAHANDQATKEGSVFNPNDFPSAIGNEYDFRQGESYPGYLANLKRYQISYDALKRRLPSDLGSMRHALWRLLNSRDEAYVDRFREAGRWDQRALPRMLTGGTSLYKMQTEVQGLRTAVSIIVDASGSMSGPAAQNSASVCIALAETMEQLAGHGVVYQIACFEDFDGGQAGSRQAGSRQEGGFFQMAHMRQRWRIEMGEGNRDEKKSLVPADKFDWRKRMSHDRTVWAANIAIFKGFNDRLASCRDAISVMSCFAGGGTPDAAGVGRAIYHVLNRPEPNKIVMVITDGCGQDEEVRRFCKFGAQVGVDVIGVGIGQTSVSRVYPISVTARDIESLGKAAFGKMVQVVLENRRKAGRKAA